MFKNVLFPIELNREARKAIELTANMVRIHQSKLTILSVVEEDSESAMASEEQVSKLLQEAKMFFSGQGIQAETIDSATNRVINLANCPVLVVS